MRPNNTAEPQEEAESLIRQSYEGSESSHDELPPALEKSQHRYNSKRMTIIKSSLGIALGLVTIYWSIHLLYNSFITKYAQPKVPPYFDPNPELWPGPTATGRAPFLAQETVAPTFSPAPNKTIERLWGHLSPYSSNYEGWGVDEYPLPTGANITQVHVRT